jgi:hypothetical protein
MFSVQLKEVKLDKTGPKETKNGPFYCTLEARILFNIQTDDCS